MKTTILARNAYKNESIKGAGKRSWTKSRSRNVPILSHKRKKAVNPCRAIQQVIIITSHTMTRSEMAKITQYHSNQTNQMAGSKNAIRVDSLLTRWRRKTMLFQRKQTKTLLAWEPTRLNMSAANGSMRRVKSPTPMLSPP